MKAVPKVAVPKLHPLSKWRQPAGSDLERLIIAIEGEKCGFWMCFEESVRMTSKTEGDIEDTPCRCRGEREDLSQEHRNMTHALRYLDKVSKVHIRSRTPRAVSRPVL